MKLEEGMRAYSKTCRDYGIGKIVNITENGQGFKGDLIDIQYKYSKHAIENQDVFASHNIIDLIQVGDYVNGYKIDYINLNCETPFLRSNQPYRVDNTLYSTLIEKGKDYNQPLHFYEEDIKSIVTKEQFDSMKYEVDSNE